MRSEHSTPRHEWKPQWSPNYAKLFSAAQISCLVAIETTLRAQDGTFKEIAVARGTARSSPRVLLNRGQPSLVVLYARAKRVIAEKRIAHFAHGTTHSDQLHRHPHLGLRLPALEAVQPLAHPLNLVADPLHLVANLVANSLQPRTKVVDDTALQQEPGRGRSGNLRVIRRERVFGPQAEVSRTGETVEKPSAEPTPHAPVKAQ